MKKIFPKLFFSLAVISVILFVVIGLKNRPRDVVEEASKCFELNTAWFEYGAGSNGKSIAMPYSPKVGAGDVVSLRAALPNNIQDNWVICIRPDQVDIKVYIDDVLRATYSTKDTRYFGNVSARRYLFVRCKSADCGKQIRIEVASTVANTGSINVTDYGDKFDVINSLFEREITDIILAFIMFIICVVVFVIGTIVSIITRKFWEIIYLTFVGMFASVWILCNSEVSQLFIRNTSVSNALIYMLLMLLPFPFLFFMNEIQKYKFNRTYTVFEYLAIIASIGCTFCQLTNMIDFSQMFLVIAGVLGVSLIMIFITMFIDIFINREYGYLIVAIGIVSAVIGTGIQVGLYIAGVSSIGGRAAAIALLMILFTAIIDSYIKLRDSETAKQLAVAQGKAESMFLSNMSHEIRTPINAVLGMNEMILRETTEPQIREYSENIENSGNMLLSIVNDILDFSKIRSGKMRIIEDKYSLWNMVEDVVRMIEPKAKAKNLEFRTDINTNVPNSLCGDEVRIKQVIINLMTNAVKYTEKGFVSLKLDYRNQPDGKITLLISIVDSGMGIKKEEQDTLFDAFSRADEKHNKNIEGTGLGLALVHNIVTAMEGTVGVNSVYGEGSTFTVAISQTVTDEGTVGEAMTKKTESTRKTSGGTFTAPDAKVLVVDDNKVNLAVFKGLLKRTLVNVTMAESGKACLELLKDNTYDVIFMDHLMPEMDGVECLKHIKAEKLAEGTPVVILTANAIGGARESYIKEGFDEYLAKPIKPEALEDLMVQFISEEKIIRE